MSPENLKEDKTVAQEDKRPEVEKAELSEAQLEEVAGGRIRKRSPKEERKKGSGEREK